MEIALFMVLIASSSVFVMLSLGYEKKNGGYGSRVLGKVLGGGKGTNYGSSISPADIEAEKARLEKHHDDTIGAINRAIEAHGYEKNVHEEPPSDEEQELMEIWDIGSTAKTDDYGHKEGHEDIDPRDIPTGEEELMKTWGANDKGYHKKHPHGAD